MRISVFKNNRVTKPKRRITNNDDYSICLGKIIRFNYDRGFGFIKSCYPKIDKEIFVHITELSKRNMYEYSYLVCEYVKNEKGLSAHNVILDSEEAFKNKVKENPNVFVEYVKAKLLFPDKCWSFMKDETNREACLEALLNEWLDTEDIYGNHFFEDIKDGVPDEVGQHPLFQELFLNILNKTDFTVLDKVKVFEILALAEKFKIDIKDFLSELIVKISAKSIEEETNYCIKSYCHPRVRAIQNNIPILPSSNVRVLKSPSKAVVSKNSKRTKEYYKEKQAFIDTGCEYGPTYEQYVRDEIADLYDEMKGMGFRKSSQLSAYIKEHKRELQIKYGFITGVLDMERNGNEFQFDGGIKKQYYAKICHMLNLGNDNTDTRVIGEKSYNKIYFEELETTK